MPNGQIWKKLKMSRLKCLNVNKKQTKYIVKLTAKHLYICTSNVLISNPLIQVTYLFASLHCGLKGKL